MSKGLMRLGGKRVRLQLTTSAMLVDTILSSLFINQSLVAVDEALCRLAQLFAVNRSMDLYNCVHMQLLSQLHHKLGMSPDRNIRRI